MSLKPGSDEAASLGCECPRAENGHGYGAGLAGIGMPMGGGAKALLWWINEECPLHGDDAHEFWKEYAHELDSQDQAA